MKTPKRDGWLSRATKAVAALCCFVKRSKPTDADISATPITTEDLSLSTVVEIVKETETKPQPLHHRTSHDLLRDGQQFVRYQLVAGQLRKRRILLWLVEAEGGQLSSPRLYWEDAARHSHGEQPMHRKREQSIAVSDISEVTIGKHSPLLLQAELAAVPADCCLSIVCRQLTLDLASKYPRHRTDWLAAVTRLRTGSLLLRTPYGEGSAQPWPRDDGITAVQLSWGVAYCNMQSIRPV